MRAWLAALWLHHGTKVLGFAEAAAGMIEYADANTINLVGGFLGPKWGPFASKAIQCTAGLMIARRGWTNSRRGQ